MDAPVASYAIRVKKSLARSARAVVPALWHLEIANGFAVAERRGVLTRADFAAGIATIEQLLSQVTESSGDFIPLRHLIGTAGVFNSQPTMPFYLETARRERLPLASLERRLLAAAQPAGLELFS